MYDPSEPSHLVLPFDETVSICPEKRHSRRLGIGSGHIARTRLVGTWQFGKATASRDEDYFYNCKGFSISKRRPRASNDEENHASSNSISAGTHRSKLGRKNERKSISPWKRPRRLPSLLPYRCAGFFGGHRASISRPRPSSHVPRTATEARLTGSRPGLSADAGSS